MVRFTSSMIVGGLTAAAAVLPMHVSAFTVTTSTIRTKLQQSAMIGNVPTRFGRTNLSSSTTSIVEREPTILLPLTIEQEDDDVTIQHAINTMTTDSNSNKKSDAIARKKSYLDDGFVFGLEGSGLERPKGKTPVIVVDGDSLETKPFQRYMVGVTFLGHSLFALSSFLNLLQLNNGNIAFTLVQAISLIVSSWILADFGSGVLHWSVDNYGNGKTPIMGSIIAAFQGHHSAPWTIAQRGFCNNVYKLCIPFGIIPMALIALIASPAVTFFMTFFCVFEILSQEFHKWSHQLPSETPAWVNTLQKYKFTIDRKPHAQHHLAPFEGNYCIISGICNNVLDRTGFFRRLEHTVFKLNGIESNAWKLDPILRERTLAGDYTFLAPSNKSSR